MIQSRIRLELTDIVVIVLTIATALVHLALGFSDGIMIMFVLNGLGYLALIGGLYLPVPAFAGYRSKIRWALVAFAAVTVLAWLAIGLRNVVGYTDKAIEIALIVLLVRLTRQKP